MTLDFLKPFYYYIEKQAVSKSIPDAASVPNRLFLKDFPLSDDDATTTFDHSKWTLVLQKHVQTDGTIDNGKQVITGVHTVDYASVADDPNFAAYLQQLRETDPDTLPKAEQLAFWMNAYNALCINLIVQAEKKEGKPFLQSINDLSEPGKPVWDQVAGQVHETDISLNTIEHEKLRKVWAEPAVHACIVCASASCPNLRQEAFEASRLKEQMDDQVRNWMSNPTKGLRMGNHHLHLSRIFLWFHKDFGSTSQLLDWMADHVENEKVAETVRKGGYSLAIRYFDYSWKINRTE